MHCHPFRSALPVVLSALLFAACAKELPRPESAPPKPGAVAVTGRLGPPVSFESQEIFLANLSPANLDMTSWKQLEPALRNSLHHIEGKHNADAGPADPALTWDDMRRTVTTLLDLLPQLDNNPALFAEHFEWRAVPNGISYSGYYEPLIRASWEQKPGYEHPIYATPPDMRRHKRRHGSYYDREAIDGRKVLAGRGLELAWAADPVDIFYLQIQGSGRLIFEDGSSVYVNYDSQNGHKYRSSGRIMRAKGLLKEGHIFEQRAWLKANPDRVNAILFENPSYIFFKFGSEGSVGAMGVTIEPWTSIATDREVIPLGSVVAYGVNIPDLARGEAPLRAIGLAQDVGGAIKNNRIDIFCGPGEEGEYVASRLDKRGPAWILVAKTDETASPEGAVAGNGVAAPANVAPKATQRAEIKAAPTPKKPGQNAKATASVSKSGPNSGLEMRDLRLTRHKQTLTLSLKLVNTTRAQARQGTLRLALVSPDNRRTPLKVTTDADFNIKNFMTKTLTLTLPAKAPNRSQILVEAMAGKNVLNASRLALPKP
jgi:membrane-bound lytic murein transglycosylase A